MIRWIKKKVKKTKQPKVKPSDATQDDSVHVYEEISDDVFINIEKTASLPSRSRKGYPLFRPDPQVRDALYSIAQIPGIDLPRPSSTSSYRRKLSFDDDAPGKPWCPSPRVIGPPSVFVDGESESEADEAWYEYDTDVSSDVAVRMYDVPSRQSRPRGRKPSKTTTDVARDVRKITLERDSSMRSRASDASSGFFSEDTDTDTMHRTSTRRKYRSASTTRTNPHHTFVRNPSITRPKHQQINYSATPSIYKPVHPARGHFRQFPSHPQQYNDDSADYLSPVKVVSASRLNSPVLSTCSSAPRTHKKVNKRRSEGHVRDHSFSKQFDVTDVFNAYEIPQFRGVTSALSSTEPSFRRPAPQQICQDQSTFWRRDSNRLLQEVIRGNYDRQMSLFV